MTARTRILSTLVALALCSATAWAADWYVDDDYGNTCATADGTATNPYCTIQEAITASSADDTINVAAGTYAESFEISKTGLSIIGAGIDVVTIDAGGLAGHNSSGIYVSADDVTLQGFTLEGEPSAALPRYGIKFGEVSGGTVTSVRVRDLFRSGFDNLGTSNTTFTSIESLDNGGHGVSLVDCNNVTVTNLTVSGSGWQGVSVATWGHYTPLGTSGIVFDGTNSFGDVFQLEEGDYNNPGVPPAGEAIITYSTNPADGADVTVQASDFGYAVHGTQDDAPDQNRIWFVQTLAEAAAVLAAAPIGHFTGADMYIESLTDRTQFYISPGGTIQAAIDAADPGDTVNVAAGTYNVATQIVIDKALTLIGENPATTIIDGPGTSVAIPCEGLIAMDGVAGSVTVKNFTLQDAPERSASWAIDLLVVKNMPAGASVTIENNILIGRDDSDAFDGGIWIAEGDASSQATIKDNDLSKMYTGIILERMLGPSTVENNDVHHLVAGVYAPDTFAAQGLYYLTYDGDVGTQQLATGNTFRDYAGIDIAFQGGHAYISDGQFTDVKIQNNMVNAIGSGPEHVHVGIVLLNDFATDYNACGVHNAEISGNTVTTGGTDSIGIDINGHNTNITVLDNHITSLGTGILVQATAGTPDVTVTGNSISGNAAGVNNTSGTLVDASGNWWGDATGPGGAGDPVSANVDYTPWCALDGTYNNPGFTADLSELWVDDDSPQTGSTGRVQEGIDLVTASTVNVAAGTYNERLTINKSLDLRGAQYGVDPTPGGARTDPTAESTIDISGLTPQNPNVAIEIPNGVTNVSVAGFTLIGSPTSHYADESIIRCWDDDISIEDNIMDGWLGALCKGAANQLVHRNRMVVNKNGVVVQPNPGMNVTISDNSITLGSLPGGDESAIYITGCTQVGITGNTCTGFVNGKGATGSNVDHITISGNTFTGNKDAVSFWGTTTFITISENVLNNSVRYGVSIKGQDITIQNNEITNNGDTGVNVERHVIDTERVTILNNDLSGNTSFGVKVDTGDVTETVDASGNWWGSADAAGVRAEANAGNGVDYTPWLDVGTDTGDPGFQGDLSTLHVDDDSPQSGSEGRIQEGVDLVAGSTVNVSDGTYNATTSNSTEWPGNPGHWWFVTVDKSLTLIGESRDGVIIDGTALQTENRCTGIWVSASNVTIKDLTIQNFTQTPVTAACYGLYVMEKFRDYTWANVATLDNVTAENLRFTGNMYSPYFMKTEHATIKDCISENSLGDGVWVAWGCDYATVQGNTITNAGDHGIWVGSSWMGPPGSNDATITDNTVNGAREGGISFVGSDGATIAGNTITNVAAEGWSVGALSLKDGVSNVEAYNNTIYDNDGSWGGYSGTGHGVGIDGTPSVINLHDNSIFGNTGYGCYNYSSVLVMAEDNWWGSAHGPEHVDDGNSDDVEIDLSTCGTVAVDDMKNEAPAGSLGDAVSEYVDFCPWTLGARLTLNADATCYAQGNTVTVRIDLSDVDTAYNIVGGDFFLAYNNTVLQLDDMQPGQTVDPSSPFSQTWGHSYGPGTIDYYVGVPFGDPGTQDDHTMAVIYFTVLSVADDCAMADLVTFRSHTPPTKLSDYYGHAVYPEPVDVPTLSVDGTAPTIAGSVSSGDLDGSCDALVVAVSVTVTDNCSVDVADVTFSVDATNYTTLDVSDVEKVQTDPTTVTISGDVVVTGVTACSTIVTIDVDADDCPGNHATHFTTSGTWTDNTPPVLSGCDDVDNIPPTFGTCEASVTLTVTATDNCDSDPDVTYERWDGSNWVSITNPYTFPSVTTLVKATAEDECSNTASCEFDVTVDSFFDVYVDVDIDMVLAAPVDRCITFEVWDCGTMMMESIPAVVSFTPGATYSSGSVIIEVPCGVDYDCITARDELHTLRRTVLLSKVSTHYEAAFTDTGAKELVCGNLNDDEWIDILDFGVFSWQWGTNYGTGDTDCDTPYPHADFNGDAIVGTGDFTPIQINYLEGREDNCCGAPGPEFGPRTRISLDELEKLGMSELAVGDLNHDGWLDEADIEAFMQGVRPKKPGQGPGGGAHEVNPTSVRPRR